MFPTPRLQPLIPKLATMNGGETCNALLIFTASDRDVFLVDSDKAAVFVLGPSALQFYASAHILFIGVWAKVA